MWSTTTEGLFALANERGKLICKSLWRIWLSKEWLATADGRWKVQSWSHRSVEGCGGLMSAVRRERKRFVHKTKKIYIMVKSTTELPFKKLFNKLDVTPLWQVVDVVAVN